MNEEERKLKIRFIEECTDKFYFRSINPLVTLGKWIFGIENLSKAEYKLKLMKEEGLI